MYRPRYCAECGHRIERERWRFWHSRLFCDACAPGFERRRRAWFSGLIITSFVLGVLMGRLSVWVPSSAPALVIERPVPSAETSPALAPASSPSPVTSASERLALCGAPTKSGRPCRRRVRGGGRCWQHRDVAVKAQPGDGRSIPLGNP